MISGRQTLGSIERSLAEVRQEEAERKARVEQAMRDINELRSAELDAYRELARFRLRGGGDGMFGRRIDSDEAQAKARLEQRELALSALRSQRNALNSDMAALVDKRRRLARERDAAGDRLDAILDQVDDRLAQDPAYRAQQEAAEAARATAEAAQAKATQAAADRQEKGAAYEADRLFIYLWQRGFGTPDYRSTGLIRMLDRWVARLVRFDDARPNYAMLCEIPERLKAYAADREAEAVAEEAKLGAMSRSAAAELAGEDLAAAVERAEQELAATAAELEALETEQAELATREQPFIAGEDADFRAAEEALLRSLRSEELSTLWQEALATPSPKDEAIVRRLRDLDKRIGAIGPQIEADQAELRDIGRRREELVKVAQRFRKKHYDNWDSSFENNDLAGVLIDELAKGVLSGADYWARTEKSHRRRRRRGGAIGFPGGVGLPGSMGGTFPGGGSDGGFGGGGFDSGDSFGGGGFETGDRF
ncbi:hypothetical protein H1W37_02330 [Stappia taiwanensis]|uniref:Uncharacterized protein n=1 Tax=Stappia taiwanensis TaxID=992267 RepID=A0A838XKV0_9HYPH|nr:hypothetical protein [Stappia taiwanensis]MBA4610477.1 hypothetical protein [Stappia taiwanensis]GGE84641.1 hypothetical protein GCM10007285_10280 [Stappia taiwanensis]